MKKKSQVSDQELDFDSEFEKMRIQNQQMEKYLKSLEMNRELENRVQTMTGDNMVLQQKLKEQILLNDNLLDRNLRITDKNIELENMLTAKNHNEKYLNSKIEILSDIKTTQYVKEIEELRNRVQVRELRIELLENQIDLEKSKKDSILSTATKLQEDLIREKKRNELVTRDGIMLEQKINLLRQELQLLRYKNELRFM